MKSELAKLAPESGRIEGSAQLGRRIQSDTTSVQNPSARPPPAAPASQLPTSHQVPSDAAQTPSYLMKQVHSGRYSGRCSGQGVVRRDRYQSDSARQLLSCWC